MMKSWKLYVVIIFASAIAAALLIAIHQGENMGRADLIMAFFGGLFGAAIIVEISSVFFGSPEVGNTEVISSQRMSEAKVFDHGKGIQDSNKLDAEKNKKTSALSNDINPATGMPMINDTLDVEGNPFGCDSQDHYFND